MDDIIKYMEKLKTEAKRVAESLTAEVTGNKQDGMLANKTRFTRTILWKDSETAKEAESNPLLKNSVQILDNFKKQVG